MTALENIKFANTKLENLAKLMAAILNDGGKFASCKVFANTSQAVKPLKEGCPFRKDDVRKDCEYTFSINFNTDLYSRRMNAQRQAEGIETREVKESPYFRLFDTKNGAICGLKKELETGVLTEVYLYAVCDTATTHTYYVRGKAATDNEVEEIKKWKQSRSAQAQKTQGVTENEVIVNSIKLTNIFEVHANGLKVEF